MAKRQKTDKKIGFHHQVRSPLPARFTVLNGSAYCDCGWCKVPIRLFDGERQKITVLIKWDEDYIYNVELQCVQVKMIPVLTARMGCFDCWNHQQRQIARYGSHFYGLREDNTKSTRLVSTSPVDVPPVKLKAIETYTVVHSGPVNHYQQRSAQSYSTTDRKLYGPYRDRKGTK